MSKNKTTESFFLSGLLIAFIVLKILGYINWSWWWIAVPIWGPVVIAGIGFCFYLLYCFIFKK